MSDQNDAKLANSCWLTLNIICNYCVHVLELNQLCWSCSLWFYGIQLLIQTMIMIYSKAIKSLFSHSYSFVMIKYLLLLLFKFRSFSNLDHLFSSFFLNFAFNLPKKIKIIIKTSSELLSLFFFVFAETWIHCVKCALIQRLDIILEHLHVKDVR